MAISKNWRDRLKKPQEVPVESLGDTILVRPMTAKRQGEINLAHIGDDGKLIDATAYSAAIVADSVLDADGSPLWNAKELLEELDSVTFGQVFKAVQSVIAPELPKNFQAASDSPSA